MLEVKGWQRRDAVCAVGEGGAGVIQRLVERRIAHLGDHQGPAVGTVDHGPHHGLSLGSGQSMELT